MSVPGDGSCWIAPDGTITWVGNRSHCGVAEDILKDVTGGRQLEEAGYVHLSFGYTDMASGKVPTQSQLDALSDIVTDLKGRNESFSDGVSSRIERFIRKNSEVPA